MARPITWQDVQYRGNAAAIEAFGRGGDRLAEAVQGMGQVAVDYRNDKIKTATDAAVAGISNSDDPVAAASALPKDWTIDPLAVAVAANARDTQLQQKRATEQNIRASEATIDTQRANLRDIEDRRAAEAIIQRNWEASAKAGRVVLSDEDANLGQASILAGKELSDRLSALRDDQRADKELGLRAREANARMRLLDKELNTQQFLSWARERGASPEAQAMRPELLDRELVAEAKRRGVDVTAVDTAKGYFQKGVEANFATPEELGQRAAGSNRTYQDGVRILSDAKAYGESQKAAILAAPYDPQNPTKPDPSRPSLLQLREVAERGPGFTEGPIGFVAAELAAKADIDQDDAQRRIMNIKSKYRYLSDAQAADLAFQSKDRWNSFGWNAATAPEVRAGAMIYREVDRLGGKEGIARLEAEATAPVDKVLREIPIAAQQLSGAARGGYAMPEQVLTFEATLAAARAKQAQKESDQAAAAAATRAINPGAARERY